MTSFPHVAGSPPRFSIGGRAASLALLRSRISQLPGLSVLEEAAARTGARRGEARVLIDVRGTGLSGYEIGRRMRRFSGVPLEFCREHRLLVVFDEDEEIGDRGERLLFALGHACQPSADAVSPGV
ncbi:hypothetical protein [Baekduia sp.]|jgi:hypothetical protein|uniref:hypothetical protein n=1 Tax=Baekduia sp. TaxID=2600305 RepID=UPI002E08E36B|nr:hypothetical protein [Baekduia sp.]